MLSFIINSKYAIKCTCFWSFIGQQVTKVFKTHKLFYPVVIHLGLSTKKKISEGVQEGYTCFHNCKNLEKDIYVFTIAKT